MSKIEQKLLDLLDHNLNPYEQKIKRLYKKRLIKTLKAQFHAEQDLDLKLLDFNELKMEINCIFFLSVKIEKEIEHIDRLEKLFQTYYSNYSNAKNQNEKEMEMLNFCQQLGTSQLQLNLDKKSFQRYFGHDAVVERYNKQLQKREKTVKYYLNRIAAISQKIFENQSKQNQICLWRELNYEKILFLCLDFAKDINFFERQSVHLILQIVKVIPAHHLQSLFSLKMKKKLLRFCLKTSKDVWLTIDAIFVCIQAFPNDFESVIEKHLKPREDKTESDHIFIRRRLIEAMSLYLYRSPSWVEYFDTFSKDPKPFVRQGVAKEICSVTSNKPFGGFLKALMCEDKEPGVRAQALLSVTKLKFSDSRWNFVQNSIQNRFENEKDEYVLRVCLHICVLFVNSIEDYTSDEALDFLGLCVQYMSQLKSSHESLAVRKWASWSLEKIWLQTKKEDLNEIWGWADQIQALPMGEKFVIKDWKRPHKLKENDLMRGLAVFSQENWGLDIEVKSSNPGKNKEQLTFVFHKGFKFKKTLWRFLHEIRNPRPDKRQAFDHLMARKYVGRLRLPSGILAEVSQTMVPGEPLLNHQEQSYRPYLPLIDDFISLVKPFRSTHEAKLYSAEGRVEVEAPTDFVSRAKAYFRLSSTYSELSNLRNWSDKLSDPPETYIQKMRELGFKVQFVENLYEGEGENPMVTRFFQ